MEKNINTATIKLFKSIIVDDIEREYKIEDELLKRTISNGFVISNNINPSKEMIEHIIDLLGLTPEQANNTFHKSWKKVKEAPIEQLIVEQVLHYITTYGFESLGIYNKDNVYIPKEKLELPEITDNIELIYIKAVTKEDIKEKIKSLLYSGVALKEDTIEYLIDLIDYVNFDKSEIENIKNKETKIRLFLSLNYIPKDGVEFLRYVIYLITGSSLLIKNDTIIYKIKENVKKIHYDLFVKYINLYSIKGLSEIFNRFKPLFLAMKSHERMKHMINKIKRKSYEFHKPMKEDYLNNITKYISQNKEIEEKKLLRELKRVNIFRKIRLLDALTYREHCSDSIVYNVRNGKSYAKKFYFDNVDKIKCIKYLVIQSIVEDIKENVNGKKIYIPENVKYALPSSEKMFVGNIPEGSYVETIKHTVFGVHWKNLETKRIDLDLSLMDINGNKLGWDSLYRNEERTILFSGDMTDASGNNGATELFYINKQKENNMIMMLNYFNYEKDLSVPYNIIVGEESLYTLPKNYMINPENIKCSIKTEISDKQKVIGIITTTTNNCKYYFVDRIVGDKISSVNSEYIENFRNYLLTRAKSKSYINRFLIDAGAQIVEDKQEADIDLSLNKLEKDTILNIVAGHK